MMMGLLKNFRFVKQSKKTSAYAWRGSVEEDPQEDGAAEDQPVESQ